MRLINADELIKDRVENDPVVIAANCAPTAFDKEKVIESLKNEATVARNCWEEFNSEIAFGKKHAYKTAIEIVEKGGIE